MGTNECVCEWLPIKNLEEDEEVTQVMAGTRAVH